MKNINAEIILMVLLSLCGNAFAASPSKSNTPIYKFEFTHDYRVDGVFLVVEGSDQNYRSYWAFPMSEVKACFQRTNSRCPDFANFGESNFFIDYGIYPLDADSYVFAVGRIYLYKYLNNDPLDNALASRFTALFSAAMARESAAP